MIREHLMQIDPVTVAVAVLVGIVLVAIFSGWDGTAGY